MKKFLLLVLLAVLPGIQAIAATPRTASVGIPRLDTRPADRESIMQQGNHDRQARKAAVSLDALEGEWTFYLGDNYFTDSTHETFEAKFDAYYKGEYLIFEPQVYDPIYFPIYASYDSESGILTFESIYLGDIDGYCVVESTFIYYYNSGNLYNYKAQATFDTNQGCLVFQDHPAGSLTVGWCAYIDSSFTESAGWYGLYDLEKVVKSDFVPSGDRTPLDGYIEFDENDIVYTGNYLTPAWHFAGSSFSGLKEGIDYITTWGNNLNPGWATLTVTGMGNYTGTLTASFYIDKAPLTDWWYNVYLPDKDTTYDGNYHSAAFYGYNYGIGQPYFYYSRNGSDDLSDTEPCEPGSYDVYLWVDEGEYFYGLDLHYVGSFDINLIDDGQWEAIMQLRQALIDRGWATPWDLSQGIEGAGNFYGLTFENGMVSEIYLTYIGFSGTFPVEIFNFPNLKKVHLYYNDLYGDLSEAAGFAMQHPELVENITEIDISGNRLSGNVGVFTAAFPNLRYFYGDSNCFSDVYPPIPPNVEYANLSGQRLNFTLDLDLSDINLDEMASKIPTILVYNHEDRDYSAPLGIEAYADGFYIDLWYSDGTISLQGSSSQPFTGQSGDELDAQSYSDWSSISTYSQFKVRIHFEEGDANFMGGFDVSDLQATILYAFDEYPYYMPFNLTAADTYRDGLINVQDVVVTTNMLLAKPTLAANGAALQLVAEGRHAKNPDGGNFVWIEDDKIMIKADEPVAALAIETIGNATINLSQFGMTTAGNGSRTVAYSLTGNVIPAGTHQIGTCAPDAAISQAAFSSPDALPMEVSVLSNVPSAVESILEDAGAARIFTPQGVEVSRLQRGINIIMRPDGSTVKINVK